MKGQLRVETLFAFLVVDEDGTEGVPAVSGPGGLVLPLVGADPARVGDLREIVQTWPEFRGKTITLAQFTQRTNLEVIKR